MDEIDPRERRSHPIPIIGRIQGDGEVVLTRPWPRPADAPASDQALQDAPRDPD